MVITDKKMYIFLIVGFISVFHHGYCDELDDIQKDFGDWKMMFSPEFATVVNIYKYNDRLESFDFTDLQTLKDKIDDYIRQLSKIKYNDLSTTKKIDYEIFNDTLHAVADNYKWRLYNALNPINFLEGPQTDPDNYVLGIPFDTEGDFVNYMNRLGQIPRQINEQIGRFNKSISYRHTYHNVSIASVPKQIERLLTDNPKTFPYYKPFNESLDNLTTISDKKKEEYRKEAVKLINAVINSFKSLKSYIEQTYMKHLRPLPGVNSWDDGTNFYKACLRWHLSLPLTPEEVHSKGLEEVNRIYGNMQKIMEKLKFKGTVKQFFESLKSDKKCNCYNKTKTEILKEFNDIIFKRIEPKLSLLFKDRPSLPVVVKPMATDGPGGVYSSGPPDGSRPGMFLLNLFHTEEMPTYDFMALSLHETNPGHHLQISTAQTAKIPSFRKFVDTSKYFQIPFQYPYYTAYVEGWALYAESLGEEMNLYKNDYELIGRYGSEIFRACRLVVDTGLHYYNWTREHAIEFMLNYTAYSRDDMTTEINRYITWPGQACAYKIGELKIRELRNKAEQELGSKFDVKDFHSVVLRNGAMPLTTLEEIVNNWIQEVKSQRNTNSKTCINGATLQGAPSANYVILSVVVLFLNFLLIQM